MAHSAKARRSVPAKLRSILEVVRDNHASTVQDIAGHTGFSEPVVDRWTRRLTAWRLLEPIENGWYRAGLALRLSGAGDPPTATGFLAELAGVVPGKVRLGVLCGSWVSYVERRASGPGRLTAAGVRPADTVAMGQALLAFGADHGAAVEHASRGRVAHTLAVTKLSGTAITRRRGKGFRVAVPVLGATGVALLAIEVTTSDLGDGFPPVLAALVSASGRLTRDPALQDGTADGFTSLGEPPS